MTLGSYPEWSAAGESGMKKNKMDTQEYQFIKETVKKQPKENGSLLRRLLMIAGCGVLFGGCAAVTFASVFPVMADREENTQQKIELTGSDVAETISEEQAAEYVEKNYKNVQWINALSKYDDDVSSNAGTATFYLQLDDDDNSVILISYDKRKEIFSFAP